MPACRHSFVKSSIPDYEICAHCATYHSLLAMPPEDLYIRSYWAHGHSSMAEQCWNVDMHTANGVCKNRFVLDRIESERGAALDIGCAPGRLMFWLKHAARFCWVEGIDPGDITEISHVGCIHKGSIHRGFFPNDTVRWSERRFDYIVGLDVFEHSPEPERFLKECQRLLTPNGQLFLMLPIADDLPADSRMFAAKEHVYLHNKTNLGDMLADIGFTGVHFDRWTIGHDTVSGRKM